MNRAAIFLLFLSIPNYLIPQDIKYPADLTNPETQSKLVGQFGKKFGTVFTVQGIIVDGPRKGYAGGPNIIVQKVNDKPTQIATSIPVSPYYGEFGGTIPKLKTGATYRLRVYETGAFVGTPGDVFKETKVILQTTSFYFQNELNIISAEKTEPVEWRPDDFIGEYALLSGIAENENDTAFIRAQKWKLKLTGVRSWAKDEIGKKAEAYGKISLTNKDQTFVADDCQARLVLLKDQIGKEVTLRGIAQSTNGYWWFNYRGQDIYVENMAELPGWTEENHFRPMEISGILEQAVLPRIDQIGIKENRDSKKYFIVRKAAWKPIKELLTPELDTQH